MDSKGNKIGLALSGGGYRAAAYHIGTLRALKNMRILDRIDVISSVSGGSIAAVYYLLHNDNFNKFKKLFSRKLGIGVMHLAIANIILFTAVFILIGIVLSGWCALLSIPAFWFFCYKLLPLGKCVELQYQWHFFGKKTLSDLPNAPSVIINTTDVAKACLFNFSKNRAWGYFYRDQHTQADLISGVNFPLSTAVMASSCVPFAFSPIRISEKYCSRENIKGPLLVDGGLYDNQGVHELSEDRGEYSAKYIIVSNAGNTELNDKYIWNIFKMLVKTSNILMKRIEKMQSRQNMFLTDNTKRRYAYVNLNYDNTDRLIQSFVYNLASGLVPSEVYNLHGISEEDVIKLKEIFKSHNHVDEAISCELVRQLKKSIRWDSLMHICPTYNEAKRAKSIQTNLIGLCKFDRYVLAKYAEWMTNVQVRLYLPNLIQ